MDIIYKITKNGKSNKSCFVKATTDTQWEKLNDLCNEHDYTMEEVFSGEVFSINQFKKEIESNKF